MSAPQFILEAETAYSTTSPKTTAAFNILQKDVLIAYATGADDADVLTISNSGAALAWTQQQVIFTTDFSWISIWTHEATQSRAGVTVTFTRSGGVGTFGGNILQFRGSGGIGSSSQTTGASAAPSLNIATTAADSAIIVVNADWTAVDGTTRTWRTNASALTETTYSRTVGQYTTYGGYHASAGPVGTYAVGLTAPTGQKHSTAAVEVKGSVPGIQTRYYRMRSRG